MYKKSILLGIIGYIAGCAVGLIFALQNNPFSFADALPQILLGGIPGAIAMGTKMEHPAGYRHPFPDCYGRDPSCELCAEMV